MSKFPRWLIVLVLGAVLYLPLLGSYGLWDPLEIKLADVAQEVARTGTFADVTIGGQYNQRPVLTVWLIALGFKMLGVNELAGRLPLALCGILALLVAFRVMRRLLSVRTALICTFVLATTPTFLFQSRQMITDVVYFTCLLASMGGIAAFVWPSDGRRCKVDLAVGGLGLVAGFLAKGLVLGALFPIFCLALTIALSWRSVNRQDRDGLWPHVDGEHIKPLMTLGESLRQNALVPLLITVGAAGIIIGVFLALLENRTFMILGAVYQRMSIPPTFETTFKELGFGFFPWFGLLPMALALFVLVQRTDTPAPDSSGETPGSGALDAPRLAFVGMLILVASVAGYILAAIWEGYLGKLRYPTLPWLAMGVGILIHHAWIQPKPVHRLWGVVAAGLVLVLHQDFFMYPQSLAFSHLTTTAKYPIELNVKLAMRAFGVLLAITLFLAMGGLPRRVNPGWRFYSWCLDYLKQLWGRGIIYKVAAILLSLLMPLAIFGWAIWILAWIVGWVLRYFGGEHGKQYWPAVGILSLIFAGWCSFYLTPELSKHMSNKELFLKFHQCRAGAGRDSLAQYQVPGRGAAYYNDGRVKSVGNQSELFELLKKPERWFILIPASHLGSIHQAASRAGIRYHVLDDTSSQYLLLSNKLEGICNKDHNPLLRYVTKTRPQPRKVVTANFENKVKLLGYDVDDVVTRGGKFEITLFFQVLGQMPSGYKVFIHFDQPANRFHGDHVPLDGKLPTQYWLPGDYIIDPHKVEIPLITTPGGVYTMYMGFWLGSNRLKVTEGPNDGVNRVRLGTLRVR